jgi:hypothetical protein
MIADILMYISIACVFASLIPACISDYKTRTVNTKIWRYAAYVGIPCAIFAFILKLIDNEIIIPSLILSIVSVLVVIVITIIAANIKDPLYKPKICGKCNYIFTQKSDIINCPNCHSINAKSILGGADMIAIDIILITSFYISQLFILTFILAFVITSAIIIIILSIQAKSFTNYRVPLIIPITIGYAITLISIAFQIDLWKIFTQLI